MIMKALSFLYTPKSRSFVLLFMVITISLICLSSCKSSMSNYTELVMSEGMRITATNDTGTIVITAGRGFKRYYTWENDTRSAVLWPRDQRWGGSLGIYHPEVEWRNHDGIRHAVLEEGQQHFDTIEEALAWIQMPNQIESVYRDDGLFVGWRKSLPGEKTPYKGHGILSADVWQIYIGGQTLSKYQESLQDGRAWLSDRNELPEILKKLNKKPVYIGGQKPLKLPGSQNDKIKVEQLTAEQLKAFEKLVK
jgi:hypothetical protein